jgi:hypothetical protein
MRQNHFEKKKLCAVSIEQKKIPIGCKGYSVIPLVRETSGGGRKKT